MAANRVATNLWQGDRAELANAAAYAFVVSAAIERHPPRAVRYLHLKLDDVGTAWRTMPEWRRAVLYAAAKVAEHVHRGDKTLVVCNMGLNRSGLIVAMALRMLGYLPEEAIMRVRAARGVRALSNLTFEDAVRNMPLGGLA